MTIVRTPASVGKPKGNENGMDQSYKEKGEEESYSVNSRRGHSNL